MNGNVTDSIEAQLLQCASCDTVIGVVDESAGGCKLYKWSLQVKKENAKVESFPVSKWISTQILAAIENSGVRRFVVEPSTPATASPRGLLVSLERLSSLHSN